MIGASLRRRWVALGVLCAAALMVSVDVTILNVALPTLAVQLHTGTEGLQWIVDAYAIVYGGSLLVAGSLADRHGRRSLFVWGLVVFGLGSLGAALSGTVGVLLCFRVVMGAGAAMMIPAGLSTVDEMFSNQKERDVAIACWSGAIGLGIAVGPLAGGLLLARFAWGSVFLVNAPIVVAALVGTALVVPESRSEHVRAPDHLGAVLSIAGLAMVLWGVIEGPSRGWRSAVVLVAILGGLGVLGGFVLWERRVDHPMLPLRFFRSRAFTVAICAVGLGMFALLGGLFLLTQFLQFDLGFDPLQAGVRILPVSLTMAIGALLSPRAVAAVGTKPVIAGGLALIVAGFAEIAAVASAQTTYGQAVIGMALVGAGAGLLLPSATDSVLSTLSLDDAGVGSAANSAAMQVGGALGVAVMGSVLTSRYQDAMRPVLAGRHLPTTVASAIAGSLGGALTAARHAGGALGRELVHVARAGFMDGYGASLAAAAAVAGVGIVIGVVLLPRRTGAAAVATDAEAP